MDRSLSVGVDVVDVRSVRRPNSKTKSYTKPKIVRKVTRAMLNPGYLFEG